MLKAFEVHPGTVNTELPRHMGSLFFLFEHKFIKPILSLAFKTPRSGAQTSLYTALDPSLLRESGKYYADCGPRTPSKEALDKDTAKWLWDMSEKMTGLSSKSS